MSAGRSFGEPMPPERMKALMNVVYNRWFLKWSQAGRLTDATWDQMAAEADQIMRQGEQYPVVRHLVMALIYELDARLHGGYTEAGRDKPLALIGREGSR